ncbi:hypothetical protein REPUB_Repub03eG0224100 [Reevesia pubescens]
MGNNKIKHEINLNRHLSFKKIKKEDPIPEKDYILRLIIHNVEGIDSPSKYPGVRRRNYRVMSWINPEEQYHTDEVKGFLKLKWDQQIDIPLNNVVTLESIFLSLEVIRVRSDCDPGPSKGFVVVGRVKVPLSKEPGFKQCKRFGLVRPMVLVSKVQDWCVSFPGLGQPLIVFTIEPLKILA